MTTKILNIFTIIAKNMFYFKVILVYFYKNKMKINLIKQHKK